MGDKYAPVAGNRLPGPDTFRASFLPFELHPCRVRIRVTKGLRLAKRPSFIVVPSALLVVLSDTRPGSLCTPPSCFYVFLRDSREMTAHRKRVAVVLCS